MGEDKKYYGVADRAWQVVVGCDPKMPCAPRCWARRTVARVVECQKAQTPKRAEFFQIALTPDLQKWSGQVILDNCHLRDPLRWRKPALIATGFHGDIGRLGVKEIESVLRVACSAIGNGHRFLFLTKVPGDLAEWLEKAMNRIFGPHWMPPDGISIGCSVMNQTEADKMRQAMAILAVQCWATHCWYEPAVGAVDWTGWEFLRGVVAGGESGTNSRASNPNWFRHTRDWCVRNRIPFFFKQWGDFAPLSKPNWKLAYHEWGGPSGQMVWRVGKKAAGRELDGRVWDELPEVKRG